MRNKIYPILDKVEIPSDIRHLNLKELERQHNDKIIIEEETKKNFLDCENEPWVTTNDRED